VLVPTEVSSLSQQVRNAKYTERTREASVMAQRQVTQEQEQERQDRARAAATLKRQATLQTEMHDRLAEAQMQLEAALKSRGSTPQVSRSENASLSFPQTLSSGSKHKDKSDVKSMTESAEWAIIGLLTGDCLGVAGDGISCLRRHFEYHGVVTAAANRDMRVVAGPLDSGGLSSLTTLPGVNFPSLLGRDQRHDLAAPVASSRHAWHERILLNRMPRAALASQGCRERAAATSEHGIRSWRESGKGSGVHRNDLVETGGNSIHALLLRLVVMDSMQRKGGALDLDLLRARCVARAHTSTHARTHARTHTHTHT
jgi:hypothetical protein